MYPLLQQAPAPAQSAQVLPAGGRARRRRAAREHRAGGGAAARGGRRAAARAPQRRPARAAPPQDPAQGPYLPRLAGTVFVHNTSILMVSHPQGSTVHVGRKDGGDKVQNILSDAAYKKMYDHSPHSVSTHTFRK